MTPNTIESPRAVSANMPPSRNPEATLLPTTSTLHMSAPYLCWGHSAEPVVIAAASYPHPEVLGARRRSSKGEAECASYSHPSRAAFVVRCPTSFEARRLAIIISG